MYRAVDTGGKGTFSSNNPREVLSRSYIKKVSFYASVNE